MFNISPMYRRSCGRIISVSDDLLQVKIKIPLTYRNRNYVGSMFGGSLFAATDPIYMTQLMQILGENYVVWDKSTEIRFKRPAYETAFVTFEFSKDEIATLIKRVEAEQEVDYVKSLLITNKEEIVFTALNKTLYISSKEYYKDKIKSKKQTKIST